MLATCFLEIQTDLIPGKCPILLTIILPKPSKKCTILWIDTGSDTETKKDLDTDTKGLGIDVFYIRLAAFSV